MTANHRPLEEGDIELIERVRATPCLYDSKNPDFRLVYKKEQQWQTVAEGLDMSHWEARKRWTVLRDRYARELKQLLLHPDSMEYGKNEFFHRMDFLRNFVKKRSVRKKCYSSSHSDDTVKNPLGGEGEEDEMDSIRPIKIFKVDGSVSTSFESDDNHDQQRHLTTLHDQPSIQQIHKTYIIDDSQDSATTGRYSYIEQETTDIIGHEHEADSSQHLGEQEYHDYVEDTTAGYEAVDEDHDTNSHYVSNHSLSATTTGSNSIEMAVKGTGNKIATNISFATIDENKLTQLPQLQQRPSINHSNNNTCTHIIPTSTSEPNDSEEYFSKTIAAYLKQLSRRYKIKAKVEMMQILEKYIELEEIRDNCSSK